MNTNINGPHTDQIKELPTIFIGKAQVKGFLFKQIKRSNTAYIYEVSDTSGNLWHEVFIRRIDKRFDKISYPKANSFGITAWSARTLQEANKRFTSISK